MLKTESSSRRWLLGALVLAVTLPSCGRGTNTPSASQWGGNRHRHAGTALAAAP